MVFGRGCVACGLLAGVLSGALSGVLGAQVVPGIKRPVNPHTSTWGCPRSDVPVTGNVSASTGDFLELTRTKCAAGCPAYTVRVTGDGSVSWSGKADVTVLGHAAAAIDAVGARAMLQQLADRGFWMLCSGYARADSGSGGMVTSLSIGGQTKTVEATDAIGPAWLRELDLEIDALADTHQWRHGGPREETFGEDRAMVDTVWPKKGVTRLMKVAARGRLGELKEMMADTSLDLNAVDSSGWTAVMYAAQAGTLDALTMLIAGRADVLRRSNAGETAMSAAVSSTAEPNPQEKVRALWTAGLNINAADNRGVTPLMLASERVESPALVAAMMKLGADPTKRDVDGNSATDYLKAQDALTRAMPDNYQAILRSLAASPVK